MHNFAFDMMYVRLFISNPTMELQSGSISISSRDVGNGWAGWEIAHPGLPDQLTLSQPEGKLVSDFLAGPYKILPLGSKGGKKVLRFFQNLFFIY